MTEPSDDDPTVEALQDRIDDLEADLDRLDGKTVDRERLEGDLRRYVRVRQRRGHARGWGPYLVLLYGTVMTLGAFYFLEGPWAILAMLVLWLSTLGLYTLFFIVGVGLSAFGLVGRLRERVAKGRRD
jgi:hypothetical protein